MALKENLNETQVVTALGGLVIECFTFPAPGGKDGEMSINKMISKKVVVELARAADANNAQAVRVPMAVHWFIDIAPGQIKKSNPTLRLKIGKVHLTARTKADQDAIEINPELIAESVEVNKAAVASRKSKLTASAVPTGLPGKAEKGSTLPAEPAQPEPEVAELSIDKRSIHIGLGRGESDWGRPDNLKALLAHINQTLFKDKPADQRFDEKDLVNGLNKAHGADLLRNCLCKLRPAIVAHLQIKLGEVIRLDLQADRSVPAELIAE